MPINSVYFLKIVLRHSSKPQQLAKQANRLPSKIPRWVTFKSREAEQITGTITSGYRSDSVIVVLKLLRLRLQHEAPHLLKKEEGFALYPIVFNLGKCLSKYFFL